jgi:hypothetical protein
MDIDQFIGHLVETCTMYAEAENAYVLAETGEDRETYGIRALDLKEHIEDDLRFFGQMSANAVIQTVSAN